MRYGTIMTRPVPSGTVRLPRSMIKDLFDISARFGSMLETLEVLIDKSTMKRIKSGKRQYSKRQYLVAKGSLEIRKTLSS